MNRADIDTLLRDGLITAPQHQTIVERYPHDKPHGRLGAIFAMIGAALCVAGIALLISANWAEIPRMVKLAAAVALLVAFHAAAVFAEARRHPAIAAALHVAGSIMFLLATALVGQVYNLSSRPPNAILLWMLGIAALPWLLQSRAQYLLWLLALVAWLGMETQSVDSLLHFPDSFDALALHLAWIGTVLLGLGALLSRLRLKPEAFHSLTNQFGVVLLNTSLLAIVLGSGHATSAGPQPLHQVIGWECLPLWLTAAGLLAVVVDQWANRTERWWSRFSWIVLLALAASLPWLGTAFPAVFANTHQWRETGPFTWLASAILFAFALVQIQCGVSLGSRATVNWGITLVGLNILAVYSRLFGNMTKTGLTFIVTGVLLVLVAWQLERWRQKLGRQMQQLARRSGHG